MANLMRLWEQRKSYPTQSFDSWCQQELQIRLDAEEAAPSASTNSAMLEIALLVKELYLHNGLNWLGERHMYIDRIDAVLAQLQQ